MIILKMSCIKNDKEKEYFIYDYEKCDRDMWGLWEIGEGAMT